ncbi:hypothetical protein T265_09160 [Opisthorchis viverrini]|uniref:Uncharacterized protein n=1 Tax=Opisthorchis viverrini TaxID=6198 RepID=A0A074Z6V7_OPIVI|nr:hypothetical protein T265_09160 [Opisthorchis viverrini]KER22823.1 hypothetical protein T265_09160 [Opisthorchis viverrini]
MGFSSKCPLRPFFVGATVSDDSYLHMLETHVIPQLNQHKSSTVFQPQYSNQEQIDIPDNSTYDAVGHVLQVFKNSRMVEQTAGIKEKANQIGAQAFRLIPSFVGFAAFSEHFEDGVR